jgi:hypothetical protein
LEIPDLFLVLNMISHSFAALTREISCSTLEINLVFPRTHVLLSIYSHASSADLDNNNEHVHATGFINFWILGIQLSSASCRRQR